MCRYLRRPENGQKTGILHFWGGYSKDIFFLIPLFGNKSFQSPYITKAQNLVALSAIAPPLGPSEAGGVILAVGAESLGSPFEGL